MDSSFGFEQQLYSFNHTVIIQHLGMLIDCSHRDGDEIEGQFCCCVKTIVNGDRSNRNLFSFPLAEISSVKSYFQSLIESTTLSSQFASISFRHSKELNNFLKFESSDQPVDGKLKCYLCAKSFAREKMRSHVGAHILSSLHLMAANLCGYCGRNGCDISLTISSGSGKNATFAPFSTCNFFYGFSLKSAAKFTVIHKFNVFS
jgi:hypothetical protein